MNMMAPESSISQTRENLCLTELDLIQGKNNIEAVVIQYLKDGTFQIWKFKHNKIK